MCFSASIPASISLNLSYSTVARFFRLYLTIYLLLKSYTNLVLAKSRRDIFLRWMGCISSSDSSSGDERMGRAMNWSKSFLVLSFLNAASNSGSYSSLTFFARCLTSGSLLLRCVRIRCLLSYSDRLAGFLRMLYASLILLKWSLLMPL